MNLIIHLRPLKSLKYHFLILFFLILNSLQSQQVLKGLRFELNFEKKVFYSDEDIYYEMIFTNVTNYDKNIPDPYFDLNVQYHLYHLDSSRELHCFEPPCWVISKWPQISLKPGEQYFHLKSLSCYDLDLQDSVSVVKNNLIPGKYKFIVEYALIYDFKTKKTEKNTFRQTYLFEIKEPSGIEKELHELSLKSMNRKKQNPELLRELIGAWWQYPCSPYAPSVYKGITCFHYFASTWPENLPTFTDISREALERFKYNLVVDMVIPALIPFVKAEYKIEGYERLIKKYPGTAIERNCINRIRRLLMQHEPD